MGYFLYAYVVAGSADKNGVTLTTTVLSSPYEGKKALFFWSEGERPPGLFSYADDTLRSTANLSVLPGYPRTQSRGDKPGENENLIQIEEDFRPPHNDPFLFHFLLPRRFVPCPNMKPLIMPSVPSTIVRDDRLSVTFVAQGPADVRFWIKRLEPQESFADFELHRLFNKPVERTAKAWIQFGVPGVANVGFGDK